MCLEGQGWASQTRDVFRIISRKERSSCLIAGLTLVAPSSELMEVKYYSIAQSHSMGAILTFNSFCPCDVRREHLALCKPEKRSGIGRRELLWLAWRTVHLAAPVAVLPTCAMLGVVYRERVLGAGLLRIFLLPQLQIRCYPA